MSTQTDAGVLLTHAPDGVGYKLLELPPELLAELESEDPPTLSLESSSTSAVIKHGDKSWGMRQKNTSNALILLRPAETTTDSSHIPEVGLKAVATIHDSVELVSEAAASVAPAARGKWHEKFARGR
ncbi:hypothetical protein JX265_000123 [Neoarthrinium moseri]|uniref:Sister chromatid cohesion protein DCC1 n=1 Tax=Neoarthrinium moseri TaxID=1658444 RepID=A0A9Q0AVY6_9PEZI|nr:uncharacterized protein JN550_001177 [Neoarthrinium moseri]KAI1853381.1 hypothetical protein JX266_002087 [Neoarthrinium moseri]KAI1877105.1 hypothetical protein JN550_001177 [Neoarthrinium moseri]KAI1881297.1 hypothetical protein JX265_000123 [Neoarthrinium moseri]